MQRYLATLLFFAVSSPVFAQSTGTINGRATDQTGLAMGVNGVASEGTCLQDFPEQAIWVDVAGPEIRLSTAVPASYRHRGHPERGREQRGGYSRPRLGGSGRGS